MDKIRIRGGRPLHGSIQIGGAKNAALPLMTACLLTDEPLVIKNLPLLADITTLSHLLVQHGVSVTMPGAESADEHGHVLELRAKRIVSTTAPYDLVRRMRASVLVLGPLVARLGQARVSLPGGCAIGTRPVDLHIKALEALGATIAIEKGYIHATAPKGLKGGEIVFPSVSVGATENALMAAAITGGAIELVGASYDMVAAAAQTLEGTGVAVERLPGSIKASRHANRLKGIDVATAPFPGFPTDLQAQFMALMATADGDSIITEAIFENRFMHVPELNRMGADITVQGASASIRGVARLAGAPVMATDLRASVSLVLAGLAAEGETMVNRVYHLDRGYGRLEAKLAACGAAIERLASEGCGRGGGPGRAGSRAGAAPPQGRRRRRSGGD